MPTKSRAFAVICIFLIYLLIDQVTPLSCGECRTTECANKICSFGYVKDPCNCCDICAKGQREECGGPWGLGGKCAESLRCTFSPVSEGQNYYFFRTGVCLPKVIPVEENLTH